MPYDTTIVWSTKLHLFIYRLILSLRSNDDNLNSSSNIDHTTTSTKTFKTIEFEFENCARVYLQLANDCRYMAG